MTPGAPTRSSYLLCALFASTLLLLGFAIGCAPTEEAPAEMPVASKLDGLEPGWNAIQPGGETVCSDGSPFEFYVRPGSEQARDEKVHFYLEGGGACWSGATCDLEGRPTYSPVVNEQDGQASTGVFDTSN